MISKSKVKEEIDKIAPVEISSDDTYEFSTWIPKEETLPFRSPVLNMYLTNNPEAGVFLGRAIRFIGENSSGKSALSLDILAFACEQKHLDNYNLIYIDKEDGMDVNIGKRYGSKVENRIKVISGDMCPDSIESFFSFVRRETSKNPCIIVNDSIDSYVSKKLLNLSIENDSLIAEGKDVKEPQMMINAKALSEEWKFTNPILSRSKSVLINISQTRTTTDKFMKDARFNASAGSSTKFFESFRFGVRQGSLINRKDAFGNERTVGYQTIVKILKNRASGYSGIEETMFLYTSKGFIVEEEIIDFLINISGTIKSTGAYLSCPELFGDNKLFKKNAIKILITDNEVRNKAISLIKRDWKIIKKSVEEDLF